MEETFIELAEVRFLKDQERLERRMIALLRRLISRQQKAVVKAFLENADALLGPRRGQKSEPYILTHDDKTLGNDFLDELRSSLYIPMVTRDAVDQAVNEDNENWNTEILILFLLGIQTGHVLFQNAVDIAVPFDVIRARAERFARSQVRIQIANIQATTTAQIRRVIALGIESGASAEVIAGQIRQQFDVIKGARAATIARTEMSAALNHGALETARETQVRRQEEITKTWITILDGNCRDDHCNAHGQTRKIDELFSVGGTMMSRPHDPTAPAEQVINCRCTMAFSKQRR